MHTYKENVSHSYKDVTNLKERQWSQTNRNYIMYCFQSEPKYDMHEMNKWYLIIIRKNRAYKNLLISFLFLVLRILMDLTKDTIRMFNM